MNSPDPWFFYAAERKNGERTAHPRFFCLQNQARSVFSVAFPLAAFRLPDARVVPLLPLCKIYNLPHKRHHAQKDHIADCQDDVNPAVRACFVN